jgi:hypothetical protein
MSGALISIDQTWDGSASFGAPGVARDDLRQDVEVRLNSVTASNTTWQWELLDKPPGSTATLNDANQEQATFTPDVPGSYRIRLTTGDGGPGNVMILIAGVTRDLEGVTVNRGWRLPAYGETAHENNFSGQLRGWATTMEAIFDDILQHAFEIAGSITVPGSSTHLLYNNAGSLGATSRLRVVSGEIRHEGAPVHATSYDQFEPQGASGSGLARSYSSRKRTDDATEQTIATISLPAGTHGDCAITVHSEITVDSTAGGGNVSVKAAFQRVGGTLTRITCKDISDPDFYTGTAVGARDIKKVDDDTIALTGIGIDGTGVTWVASSHVIVARLA